MDVSNRAGSGSLRKRELCTVVALDVANAFNTTRWGKIAEALYRKKTPPYLMRVIHNYLSKRTLVYRGGQKQDALMRRSTGIGTRATFVERHE